MSRMLTSTVRHRALVVASGSGRLIFYGLKSMERMRGEVESEGMLLRDRFNPIREVRYQVLRLS